MKIEEEKEIICFKIHLASFYFIPHYSKEIMAYFELERRAVAVLGFRVNAVDVRVMFFLQGSIS